MQVKIDATESKGNRLLWTETIDVREIESLSGARRIARQYRGRIDKGEYLWVYFLDADKIFQFTPSQLR